MILKKFERDTLSDQTLQDEDGLDKRYYTIKDASSATPLSFRGDVPFRCFEVHTLDCPDRTDPMAEPLPLLFLARMGITISGLAEPMATRYGRSTPTRSYSRIATRRGSPLTRARSRRPPGFTSSAPGAPGTA